MFVSIDDDVVDQIVSTRLREDHLDWTVSLTKRITDFLNRDLADYDQGTLVTDMIEEVDSTVDFLESTQILYDYYNDEIGVELVDEDAADALKQKLEELQDFALIMGLRKRLLDAVPTLH